MEILGIGPLELFFILIIALIVLGPSDMVKAGRTLGRFLRRMVTSPVWQTVQQTSRDLRYLPNKLMREAGIEELEELKKAASQQAEQIRKDVDAAQLNQDIKHVAQGVNQDLSDWTTPPPTIASPPAPAPAEVETPEIPPEDQRVEDATPNPSNPADNKTS